MLIEAPFTFGDGDPYQVYIQEKSSGMIRLTDAGHTLMHLSYTMDVDLLFSGTRQRLMDGILQDHNVEYDDGEFYVDALPLDISKALFRLAHALTQITDLSFLNRARIQSTFYDDLDQMLINLTTEEKIQRDYIYKEMDNAEHYPIDYRFEGKRDPLFLFGIPNKDKARLVTIVLEHLIGVKAEFESLLVFSDMEKIPRGDLARLLAVGGETVPSLETTEMLTQKLRKRVDISAPAM